MKLQYGLAQDQSLRNLHDRAHDLHRETRKVGLKRVDLLE